MKIIEFLFYIVNHFLSLKPDRIEHLQNEASKWEVLHKENEDSKIGKFLKKSEVWYVQLGLALFCLFSIKSIGDWFYSVNSETIEDEEEVEYINDNSKKKKFRLF